MTNNAPDYQDNLVFPPQEPTKRDVVLNYAIISELRDQITALRQTVKFLLNRNSELNKSNCEQYIKAKNCRIVLENIINELTEPDDDIDAALTQYFSNELIQDIKEVI